MININKGYLISNDKSNNLKSINRRGTRSRLECLLLIEEYENDFSISSR